MHYLGLLGVPRRYYDLGQTAFVPDSAHTLNAFISVVALIVGVAQLVFLFNLIWSLRHGRDAGGNPWNATTLEWQTPETPPAHGNWGPRQPVVYRWAYDYSVPGAERGLHPAERPASRAARPDDRRPWCSSRLALMRRSPPGGWRGRGLATKPWLQAQPAAELAATGSHRCPTAKIGLGVFLAVAGLLLRLFVSAYVMRMDMADWQPLPGATAALGQYRRAGAQQRRAALGQRRRPARQTAGVQDGLLAGGLTALLSWSGRSWPGGSSPPPATVRRPIRRTPSST